MIKHTLAFQMSISSLVGNPTAASMSVQQAFNLLGIILYKIKFNVKVTETHLLPNEGKTF